MVEPFHARFKMIPTILDTFMIRIMKHPLLLIILFLLVVATITCAIHTMGRHLEELRQTSSTIHIITHHREGQVLEDITMPP
jgi:TM2 domain-containing membrane protein YozV